MRPSWLLGIWLLAAACGSGGEGTAGKPRQILLWAFGGVPRTQVWLRQGVADFNAGHPEIQITFENRDWNTQRESLITAAVAGEGPDLVYVHHKYSVEFGELGALYALENFADFPQIRERYFPHILEHVQFQGKHYGIPATTLPFVMAYNRKILAAQGLQLPRTWEEMVAMGARLMEAGVHVLTMPCSSHGDTAYRFAALLYKAGGRVLSEDWTRATFNGPAGLAALNLLLELKRQGYMPEACTAYANDENIAHWCGGRALFSVEGPWWQDVVTGDYHFPLADMGLAPLPVSARPPESNPSRTLLDIVMVAITGYTPDPEASWTALKALFVDNPVWQVPEPSLVLLPALKAAYAPGVKSTYVNMEVLAGELMNGLAWPGHPRISEIQALVAEAVNMALTGAKTAQQALDEAAREVDEILAE
jgi:multiple sugar transport system substrate-binding protein